MRKTRKEEENHHQGKIIHQMKMTNRSTKIKKTKKDQETEASLDADYSVDEFNLDEQLDDIEFR